MIKDFFRIIGAACILSGIILYFSPGAKSDTKLAEQNKALQEEMETLQAKLQKTEKELANLQTLSADASSSDEEQKEEVNEVKQLRLTIETGTTSKNVADELKNAGIVEDAKVFNDYLTDNQFSRNIQVGIYEIDETMTEEEIAKLITTLVE